MAIERSQEAQRHASSTSTGSASRRAIEKACVATGVEVSSEILEAMTDDVISELEKTFLERIPGVEDIQDVVEMKLAERGLFEVAKAYILYRREHAELRGTPQDEILERIGRRDIRQKAKRRDGRVRPARDRETIANCCRGHEGAVDVVGILRDTNSRSTTGYRRRRSTRRSSWRCARASRSDPVYSTLAARLLLNDLYKQVLGVDEFDSGFDGAFRASFAEQIGAGVDGGRLDPRLLEYDFARLGAALRPERDRFSTTSGRRSSTTGTSSRTSASGFWRRRSTSGCGSRWGSRSPSDRRSAQTASEAQRGRTSQ